MSRKDSEIPAEPDETGESLPPPEILPAQPETSAAKSPEIGIIPDSSRELEGLREEVENAFEVKGKKTKPAGIKKEPDLLGDFRDSQITGDGKIQFTAEEQKDAHAQIREHKGKFAFSPPSLVLGAKTDTEYDSNARNFSTRTKILTLEDGNRVFAVYNYPTSIFHRALDGFSKHMAGDRMSKASSADWKGVFESRSNIPVIECDDPQVVLMPYLPNVNAHDLFADNHKIKDFGPCPWAENITMEDKLELGEQIIREIENVHKTGKCWGETILPNVIITAEKKPVIVDPETQYDKGVPVKEQMARDLRDVIMSICGSLHASEKQATGDYGLITERLMTQYSDKEVLGELKRVVSQKPTFIQKIFRGFYETARLGIPPKEYEKVVAAILASGNEVAEK